MFRQKVPILFTEARPSDTSDAHGSHLRSKVENGRSTDPRSDFETNMDGEKNLSLDSKKNQGCPPDSGNPAQWTHEISPPTRAATAMAPCSVYSPKSVAIPISSWRGLPSEKYPLHPLQWMIKRYTYYLGSALASLSVEARSYFLNKPYLQKPFPKSIQVLTNFCNNIQ